MTWQRWALVAVVVVATVAGVLVSRSGSPSESERAEIGSIPPVPATRPAPSRPTTTRPREPARSTATAEAKRTTSTTRPAPTTTRPAPTTTTTVAPTTVPPATTAPTTTSPRQASIVVGNAGFADGLAARVQALLTNAGFTNVRAATAGPRRQTSAVLYARGSEATAKAVAAILGITTVEPRPAGQLTDADTAGTVFVLVGADLQQRLGA